MTTSAKVPKSLGLPEKSYEEFERKGVPRASQWFKGTINIDLTPLEFQIIRADYEVTAAWHPEHPAFEETFWLVDVTLEFQGTRYPAYLYYPRRPR